MSPKHERTDSWVESRVELLERLQRTIERCRSDQDHDGSSELREAEQHAADLYRLLELEADQRSFMHGSPTLHLWPPPADRSDDAADALLELARRTPIESASWSDGTNRGEAFFRGSVERYSFPPCVESGSSTERETSTANSEATPSSWEIASQEDATSSWDLSAMEVIRRGRELRAVVLTLVAVLIGVVAGALFVAGTSKGEDPPRGAAAEAQAGVSEVSTLPASTAPVTAAPVTYDVMTAKPANDRVGETRPVTPGATLGSSPMTSPPKTPARMGKRRRAPAKAKPDRGDADGTAAACKSSSDPLCGILL